MDVARTGLLLDELRRYRDARVAMLDILGLPRSNRDPLAEFSEHLALALLGGKLADSRVQAGWDLELDDAARAQVRYLANPSPAWVNEHMVHSIPGVHWYVLVLFEAFEIIGVIAFPPNLAPVCELLGKRHDKTETTLQFTRRNWLKIAGDPSHFESLGAKVWLPPFVGGVA